MPPTVITKFAQDQRNTAVATMNAASMSTRFGTYGKIDEPFYSFDNKIIYKTKRIKINK